MDQKRRYLDQRDEDIWTDDNKPPFSPAKKMPGEAEDDEIMGAEEEDSKLIRWLITLRKDKMIDIRLDSFKAFNTHFNYQSIFLDQIYKI